MVSEALAAVLRSGRDGFNQQFTAARRANPSLDGEAFLGFVRTAIDPLAVAVHAEAPDRVADVVLAAYAIGLELCAQSLAGPGARRPVIDEGWQVLLPPLARLVAAAPARVLAAVSNALARLGDSEGARPRAWIDELARLAPLCGDVPTFLAVGQICAWRAGLAHFRAGALAVADALPAAIAARAFGVEAEGWPAVRARLGRDPWFDPRESAPAAVRAVGGFVGFGGRFSAPPRVATSGGHLLVSSGDEAWLLTADVFGATFHRASAEECASVRPAPLPASFVVSAGELAARGRRIPLGVVGEITSVACDGSTVAITSALGHAVVLVPLSAFA